MKILIFGATGMVGAGVLRECLLAADVTQLRTVGRTPMQITHPKLIDLVVPDILDWSPTVQREICDFDACFFCIGVSSSGRTEADYSRITHDITIEIAKRLVDLNPQSTFVYVSGAGTDTSEKGDKMWARVKGKTENSLLRLPFAGIYLFRPSIIIPMNGERSKTLLYRLFYQIGGSALHLVHRFAPSKILTTEIIGRAMLAVARKGGGRAVMDASDIKRAGS